MNSPAISHLTKMAVGILAVIITLVATSLAASAHVKIVASTPANISTVDEPLSRVTLEYSGPADPIADSFAIENSTSGLVAISSVVNDGATKVVVTSTNPLPIGRNKVSWALRSSDGHKMTGVIAFDVVGQSQVTTSTTFATALGGAVTEVTPTTTSPRPATENNDALKSSVTESTADSNPAETLATAGRWLVFSAILFVVGGLAYLVWVHRGPRREGRRIVYLIRRGSIVVILGSIVEWGAQLALYNGGGLDVLVSPKAWGGLIISNFAFGTFLRIFGAILVLRYVSIDVVSEDPIDYANVEVLDLLGEFAGSGTTGVGLDGRIASSNLSRVRVESSPLAFVGAFLLVVSEAFIGHTASVEPRALMIASDIVHMTAAGIWVAGVWLLTWTLWQRRRRKEPLDARLLATKFSLLATWSLVAVGISGFALSWMILNSVSDLWSTSFGRILALKLLIVALIAAFGLHNRRNLVPALESPGNDYVFFRTIVIEAALFFVVLAVTSILVVSNPLA